MKNLKFLIVTLAVCLIAAANAQYRYVELSSQFGFSATAQDINNNGDVLVAYWSTPWSIDSSILTADGQEIALNAYEIDELGRWADDSIALKLNNSRQAVGYQLNWRYLFYLACTWDNQGMVNVPNSLIMMFNDINESGLAVGHYQKYQGPGQAVTYSRRTGVRLLAQDGYDYANAWAVNNSGEVAGEVTSGPITQACYWDKKGALNVLPLGNRSAMAVAINNHSSIAGHHDTFGSINLRGFVWSKGRATDIGTLGGQKSLVHDINNADVVVGEASRSDDYPLCPFVWTARKRMQALPLPPEAFSGYAAAINDQGVIVGTYYDFLSRRHAIMWLPQ